MSGLILDLLQPITTIQSQDPKEVTDNSQHQPMTDDVYTLGENLPCTSPVGQQSGSFENLRAVFH